MNLVAIYCLSDEFVKFVDKNLLKKKSMAGRKGNLSKAEYITMAIIKQELGFHTNKQLYNFIKSHMKKDFSALPSYSQFNEGINSIFSTSGGLDAN